MLRRLADAIGLREGEEARTGRLFVLIFALTIAFVFAKAAQQGIFLGAYGRARIPDAFIVSALLLAATSFLSSALAARLGPVQLLSLQLVAVTGFFVAAVVSLDHLPAGPMVLYALVEAAIGLLLVQAWAVVTEVLDVRAAKRLLPLIGNAASIGWAVGGFTTRPLAHALGTRALLVGSAGLFAGCFFLMRWILAADLGGRAARGRKGVGLWAGARAGVGAVARNPLLRVLALITVAGLLTEQLLDYQLFASAQVRYAADADRIAAFMGTFFGVTGVIGMVVQLVLSGRVLTLMGSTNSAQAAPAAALIGSLVFVLAPGFAVIVATRGAYRILKQSLASPARAQIQGVLPSVQRSQAGALLKGVLAPLFYALGGGALKLVAPDTDLRYMAAAAVLLAAVSVAGAALWLRRAYVNALRRSIDRRRLDLGAVGTDSQLAPEHYEVLADELDDSETRAALAVSILSCGEPRLARPLLRRALQHDSAVVRTAAAEALGELGEPADARRLATLLRHATDEEEQRAAMAALVTLGGPAVDEVLGAQTDAGNLHIRALARAHVEPEALLAMMQSTEPDQREAAAWALTQTPDRRRGGAPGVRSPARRP